MKKTALILLLVLLSPLHRVVSGKAAGSAAVLRYLSPLDGSQFVPPGTTVALRLDGPINPASLSNSAFSALGSASGQHTAAAFLAADGATVIYQPNTPFAPGEAVTVTLAGGLAEAGGAVFAGLQTRFNISAGQPAADWAAQTEEDLPMRANVAPSLSAPAAAQAVSVHPQDYVTFPHDFPAYTVTVPASGTAPSLLFVAPLHFAGPVGPNFLLIADDTGEPIFWQPLSLAALDFKQQPDGSLTYFDLTDKLYHVLDKTYSETRTIAAANGYHTDSHDLQILPNGDALLLIYDNEITSTVQFGGYPTATVTGMVIQELDTSGFPVFQWRSWDHFAISDTYQSLTTTVIDYVHANAIELDNIDHNLLLSSRHLSEITKIARTYAPGYNVGDIIWRLGGKNNQFSRSDPEGPFTCQHDIRRLANGDLTLFDNHNPNTCPPVGGTFSRAVEYQIDETNKLVTNTWQYRNNPDVFGFATGNNQRLPDGHRLIDWGVAHPNVTEVLTDGTKAFEFTFEPTVFTYRAFRFPWAATPYWDPLLVLTGTTPTLYYSWNGATDVASYEIYAGSGAQPQTLLGTQARTGFEDQTPLTGALPSFCAFRVRPINHAGQPQRFSNVVYRSLPCNPSADVGVLKSVNSGAPLPGQMLTYTLVYSNAGPDLAPGVVLTDIVPGNLVGITYTSSGAALTATGVSPYAWLLGGLAPGAGGVVTVTGVLSGGLHGSVFTNTASITTAYTDTNLADNTSAISVTVANVAPLAASDGYTLTQNATLTLTAPGVLANDYDANHDVLTATLSAGPAAGSLDLQADGSFTYTPPFGFTGPITFTYQAGDGQSLSAPAVVTITVQAYRFFLPWIQVDAPVVAPARLESTGRPFG